VRTLAITFLVGSGLACAQSHTIRAGTLIDGRGNVLRDQTVEIGGGKITAIRASDGKEEFHLSTQTVMPGWIGACLGVLAHDDRVEAASKAFTVLKTGFTTAVSNARYKESLFAGPRIVPGSGCKEAEEFLALRRDGGAIEMHDLEKVTYWAAVALGISDRVGSVVPGLSADLIATDGNPLQDASALQRIVFIMKGGRVYREPAAPFRLKLRPR
jgi:imidazolonepropionase-like amidohydrolase